MQETHHYDIIVIGSGPAGEKAAMQASKLKKQVALIEKSPRLGGASLHWYNSFQITARNCDASGSPASANSWN